ncbi:MAG: hypothetical protein J0L97_07320 [Alphaproteobacteria bacterium]|nr:hypothetical protein [Alphaproteobacteria bacterium]
MTTTQLFESSTRDGLISGNSLSLRFTVGETQTGEKFFFAAVQGDRMGDLLDAFASVVKTDAETRGCRVFVEKDFAATRRTDTWKLATPALIINGRRLEAESFEIGQEVTYQTAVASIGPEERKRCSGLNLKYARTSIQKDAAEAANTRLHLGQFLVVSQKGEWEVDDASVRKRVVLEDQSRIVNLERLTPTQYAAYLNAALKDYFAWRGAEAQTSAFVVCEDTFALAFVAPKQAFEEFIIPEMPLRLDYHKAETAHALRAAEQVGTIPVVAVS